MVMSRSAGTSVVSVVSRAASQTTSQAAYWKHGQAAAKAARDDRSGAGHHGRRETIVRPVERPATMQDSGDTPVTMQASEETSVVTMTSVVTTACCLASWM